MVSVGAYQPLTGAWHPTTVLGKMLAYEPQQRFKPETWAKLDAGIARLEEVSPIAGYSP